MTVEDPCTFLTFLAAVLRSPASSAFGKLPCELLPLPTLVVRTLPYSTPTVVLAAQIPHYNSSPVLHILTVVSNCEFLDEREDIEVVWEEVFFLFRIAGGSDRRGGR
jgi:hypothetical protein